MGELNLFSPGCVSMGVGELAHLCLKLKILTHIEEVVFIDLTYTHINGHGWTLKYYCKMLAKLLIR